ncbi:hypothetical protein A9X02_20045 [Mycobacterium malmoense]|nr:hypothetical protein A9X02_20045 [Mycobacterium malmoense]
MTTKDALLVRTEGPCITVGVDLASQPDNTAVCVITWSYESAEVSALASGSLCGRKLDDSTLLSIVGGLTPIG